MNLSLKKCRLEHLDHLIEISRTTFSTAFEKDNNSEDFKIYMDSAFSKEKIKSELLNPNSIFYFAYLNDTLIGYFKLNRKEVQSEPFAINAIELERIYVLKSFQGKHIGKHLLFKIINICKEKKASFLWLGVWEHNKAAIRFYKRYNFKKFDIHSYFIGNDEQIDWLMKLPLV